MSIGLPLARRNVCRAAVCELAWPAQRLGVYLLAVGTFARANSVCAGYMLLSLAPVSRRPRRGTAFALLLRWVRPRASRARLSQGNCGAQRARGRARRPARGCPTWASRAGSRPATVRAADEVVDRARLAKHVVKVVRHALPPRRDRGREEVGPIATGTSRNFLVPPGGARRPVHAFKCVPRSNHVQHAGTSKPPGHIWRGANQARRRAHAVAVGCRLPPPKPVLCATTRTAMRRDAPRNQRKSTVGPLNGCGRRGGRGGWGCRCSRGGARRWPRGAVRGWRVGHRRRS